jgi:hypothetical protein
VVLTVRGMKDAPFPDKMSVWVLGAALLTHAVNFISISYFDQNVVNWYMLLAMISTVSGPYLLAKHGAPSQLSNYPPLFPAQTIGPLNVKTLASRDGRIASRKVVSKAMVH